MTLMQAKKENKTIYALLLFQLLLSIICIVNGKMGNDEGMWSYIGRVWAEHDIAPYEGAIENKTPGIFIINYLSYKFFGVNYIAPRLVGVLVSLLTSFFIFKIGRILSDQVTGLSATTLCFSSLLWSLTNGPYQANTEIFMIFFNVLAFFLLVKSGKDISYLISWQIGFVLGFAIGFKQIAILTFAGYLIYLICRFRADISIALKLISVSVIGSLLSTFLTILPLLLSGVSLSDYFEGAWLILFNEGSSYPISPYRFARFFDTFFDSRMVIFYPILLTGFFYWSTVKQIDFTKTILGWLIIAFLGVNASGYYSGHQISQLLPALSLFCGIILGYSVRKLNMQSHRLLLFIGLLVLLPYNVIFSNADTIVNSKKPVHLALKAQIHDRSEHSSIARWIQEKTAKKNKIYYYGKYMNPILSYSGRVSASKYFNTFFITNDGIKQKVENDLKNQVPKFIIKGKGTKEKAFIEAILKANYKAVRKANCCIVFKKIY